MNPIFTPTTSAPAQAATITPPVSTPAPIEVSVRQLPGMQWAISIKGKELVLSNPILDGNLKNQQNYKAVLSSSASNQVPETVLKLFEPSSALSNVALPSKGTSDLQSFLAQVQQIIAGKQAITFQAKVIAVSDQQIQLQVSGKSVTLSLPDADKQFRVGQQVQLNFNQQSQQWQLQAPSEQSKATLPRQQNPILNQLATDKGAIIEVPKTQLNTLLRQETQLTPTQIEKLPATLLLTKQGEQWQLKIPAASEKPIATFRLSPKEVTHLQQAGVKPAAVAGENYIVRASQPEAITTVHAETAAKHSTPAASQNQVESIKQLLRVLQPQTESPSLSIKRIEAALSDPQLMRNPDLKPVVEQLKAQIQQALPQGKPEDVRHIQQLLSSPPLNLSPVQLISPPPSQGFIAGLVAILQVSLAARLNRQQPAQLDKITEALAPLLTASKGTGAATPTSASRSLSDFLQADQRNQLLKELGRILSSHQSHKTSSADGQLQGQEGLYYVLPIGQGDQRKDIELLIKRQQQNEEDKDKLGGRYWQLNMKLDIGNLGEMLARAKVSENYLELDLYTANENLLAVVKKLLPLFEQRLLELGIELGKSQCQLGKIPDTLRQRPYQLFETKA